MREWTRVTSLTQHDGLLFASVGSCTSAAEDAPADVRGSVWAFSAGVVATTPHTLAPGRRHIAAVRRGGDGSAMARHIMVIATASVAVSMATPSGSASGGRRGSGVNSAVRGAGLVGLAVILGIVLLQVIDKGPAGSGSAPAGTNPATTTPTPTSAAIDSIATTIDRR